MAHFPACATASPLGITQARLGRESPLPQMNPERSLLKERSPSMRIGGGFLTFIIVVLFLIFVL